MNYRGTFPIVKRRSVVARRIPYISCEKIFWIGIAKFTGTAFLISAACALLDIFV